MNERRFRLAVVALAIVAGVLVFLIATTVFPHHSSNHDEAVYLQQADLLLHGQFSFTAANPEAVQPWFFVRDGSRLYPKYTPVTAAMFAPGVALGIPRLPLAVIAALNAGLVALVTREVFDDRTGLLAGALFVSSPLFLMDSSVFLPYAPTTALNLLFALGYLRSWRATSTTRRRRYALLAGGAIGLSFFSRPFTAVLFGAPFVGHSLLAVGRALRDSRHQSLVLERVGIVAALGTAGVLVALAYNQAVTGDALVFPYQAFAPLDGPGFGYRRILGYERVYSPSLALEANGLVLRELVTRWTPIPPLGSLAAAVGLVTFLAREHGKIVRVIRPLPDQLGETGGRALLAGLFVSVPLGNVFFWGNVNILAALDDPTDGLVSQFGPFYHFDLLLPLAAFGAAGLLVAFDGVSARLREKSAPATRRVVVTLSVVALLTAGGLATGTAISDPIERTEPYTDRYEQANEPFEDRSFENALVILPTPYGDWLNHPFQSLRNDATLDGDVVYALDLNASSNFAVLDTYNRTPYRYEYRGEWRAAISDDYPEITPRLRPLRVETGQRHRIRTTVGRVVGTETVSIRLASGNDTVQYGVERLPPETLTVDWEVAPGEAYLTGENLRRYSDDDRVTFEGTTELILTITFTQTGDSTVTYRQEVPVRSQDDQVAVIWPPERQVCRLVTECGTEGTYIRGADEYVGGVSFTDRIQPLPPRNESESRR